MKVAFHKQLKDECQLYLNPKLVEFKIFESKEAGEAFVKEWKGEQLSPLTEGKQWYVTLPNDVSRSIEKAIKKTEDLLKLNVPLGFEWVVSKDWYGCH